jgi:His/Glu/Gln/Arg/opine family amino acid ABC transporter permease subunit
VDVYSELLKKFLLYILKGAEVTVHLTVFSLILSVALGLLGAITRTSANRILSAISTTYVEIIRGTPALLQLFIIYFGLANYHVRMEGVTAAIIALGFIGGAYLTETFRAGIEAVDKGQVEAALSLGMRAPVVMRRIVLPQAMLIVLPPFGNFVIGLIKDTSLALTISVPEIMYRAYDVSSQTFRSMEVFSIAGMIYLAICFPLSRAVKYLERFRPPQ